MINIKDATNPDKFREFDISSLADLKKYVEGALRTCELNHRDPKTVPVFIKDSRSRNDYPLDGAITSFGGKLIFKLSFRGDEEHEIDYFEGEDKQPEGGGEFWQSRGPSDSDVSGFVVSKAAGERLLQMVRKVLGKEQCDSFLDWRKHEPNWIQFKFWVSEFDLEKLDKMSRENGGVMTEDILKVCKKNTVKSLRNLFRK